MQCYFMIVLFVSFIVEVGNIVAAFALSSYFSYCRSSSQSKQRVLNNIEQKRNSHFQSVQDYNGERC